MRVATILFAYLASGFIGALAFAFFMGGRPSLGANLELVGVVAALGLVGAVPVAFPVIAISEDRGTGDPAHFLLGGVAAGLVTFAIFGIWMGVSGFVLCLSASTTAAMAYWFIAWHLFPPARLERTAETEEPWTP